MSLDSLSSERETKIDGPPDSIGIRREDYKEIGRFMYCVDWYVLKYYQANPSDEFNPSMKYFQWTLNGYAEGMELYTLEAFVIDQFNNNKFCNKHYGLAAILSRLKLAFNEFPITGNMYQAGFYRIILMISQSRPSLFYDRSIDTTFINKKTYQIQSIETLLKFLGNAQHDFSSDSRLCDALISILDVDVKCYLTAINSLNKILLCLKEHGQDLCQHENFRKNLVTAFFVNYKMVVMMCAFNDSYFYEFLDIDSRLTDCFRDSDIKEILSNFIDFLKTHSYLLCNEEHLINYMEKLLNT